MAGPPVDVTAPFELDRLEETSPSTIREADRTFGPYHLSYEMAAGGMGTVSLGSLHDSSGTQIVALKRIHPHLAHQQDFVKMLLDEARIASRINHPNVCSVIDYGEVNGIYYIAMEYLSGVPLWRLMQTVAEDEETRLSSEWHSTVALIVAAAADGLHAAHELTDEGGESLGVIHRDISPDNIFVTFEGEVKVLDFGIAFARNRLYHTQNSTIKGKLAYMAPERFRAQPLDRRSDIWSLGVCLWEGLVGRHLFGDDSNFDQFVASFQARRGRIPPPSAYCSTVRADLDDVTLEALSWERDHRFPTAHVLSKALRQLDGVVSEQGAGSIAKMMRSRYTELLETDLEIVRTIVAQNTWTDDTAETRLHLNPDKAIPTTQVAYDSLAESKVQQATKHPFARSSRIHYYLLAIGVVLAVLGLGVLTGVYIATNSQDTDRRTESEALQRALVSSTPLTAEAPPPTTPTAEFDARNPISTPPSSGLGIDASIDEIPTAFDNTPSEGDDAGSGLDVSDSSDERSVEASSDVGELREATKTVRRQHRRGSVGTVNVVTRGGWADVYIEGRRIGPTPRRISLRPGRHVLVLRPFGGTETQRVVVNVQSGETTPVVVRVSDSGSDRRYDHD